tara:strand:- start:221 stop:466 length:246 start_codon:yes stop_codon:yes gene_type:complete
MGTPFKMKGSPMQRNFGIGSPMRDVGDVAMENIKKGKTTLTAKAKAAWNTIKDVASDDFDVSDASDLYKYNKSVERGKTKQ